MYTSCSVAFSILGRDDGGVRSLLGQGKKKKRKKEKKKKKGKRGIAETFVI